MASKANGVGPWPAELVGLLVRAKREGCPEFEVAWEWARKQLRVADRPYEEPRGQLRLEEPDEPVLTFYGFFKEACRREWEGLVHVDFRGLQELGEPAEAQSVYARRGNGRLVAV